VFSAPVAVPLLVQLFAEHDALAYLPAFLSQNAQRIYRIQPPTKHLLLRTERWQVPAQYGELVPFMAGREIAWKVITP
jgi:dihydroorotase